MAALLDDGYQPTSASDIDPRRAADDAATRARVGRRLAEAVEPPQHARGERLSLLEDESVLDTSYLCAVDRWARLLGDPERRHPPPRSSPDWALSLAARLAVTPEPDHACSVAPGKRPRLTPEPGPGGQERRMIMPFGTPAAMCSPGDAAMPDQISRCSG